MTGRQLLTAISRAYRARFQDRHHAVDDVAHAWSGGTGISRVSEVAYLWSTPHMIDDTRLAAAIGEVPHTPLDPAIAVALDALGLRRRAKDRA